MSIKGLGKYQWEWLNKYGKISLNECRSVIIDIDRGEPSSWPEWYYVGNWSPTEIEPCPSKKDGYYEERRKNLKINPYFYWPTNNSGI